MAGFLFLAVGEVAREAAGPQLIRLLVFMAATFALAVALALHLGMVP